MTCAGELVISGSPLFVHYLAFTFGLMTWTHLKDAILCQFVFMICFVCRLSGLCLAWNRALYVLIERAVGSLGFVEPYLVDDWTTRTLPMFVVLNTNRRCTFISTDKLVVEVQFSLLLALHSDYGGQLADDNSIWLDVTEKLNQWVEKREHCITSMQNKVKDSKVVRMPWFIVWKGKWNSSNSIGYG